MLSSDDIVSLKAEVKKLAAALEDLSLKMVANGEVELGKLTWFKSPCYSGSSSQLSVNSPIVDPLCKIVVANPPLANVSHQESVSFSAPQVFDEMSQPILSSTESLVSDKNIEVYDVDAPKAYVSDRDQNCHVFDILESSHKVFDKTPVPTFMLEMAQVAQSDSTPVSLVSSVDLPSNLADVTAESSVGMDGIHLYDYMEESLECIPLKDVQVLGSLAIHRYPEFELEESTMHPSQSLLPTIENGDSYMYEDGKLEVHVAMVYNEANQLCENTSVKVGMTSTEHNFRLIDEVHVMLECKSGQNIIDRIQLRDTLNMLHYPVSEINPRVIAIEPKSMTSLAPIQALPQTPYFVDVENEVLWLGENHMGSEGVLWETKPNSVWYQIVFDPGISFLCGIIADSYPCITFFELKIEWKPLVSYKEIHSWGKFWVRLIRTEGFENTLQLPSIHICYIIYRTLTCDLREHSHTNQSIGPYKFHALSKDFNGEILRFGSLLFMLHTVVYDRRGARTARTGEVYYLIILVVLVDKMPHSNVCDLVHYVFGEKLTTKGLNFQFQMLHGLTLSKFFDPGPIMTILLFFKLTLEDKGLFKGWESMPIAECLIVLACTVLSHMRQLTPEYLYTIESSEGILTLCWVFDPGIGVIIPVSTLSLGLYKPGVSCSLTLADKGVFKEVEIDSVRRLLLSLATSTWMVICTKMFALRYVPFGRGGCVVYQLEASAHCIATYTVGATSAGFWWSRFHNGTEVATPCLAFYYPLLTMNTLFRTRVGYFAGTEQCVASKIIWSFDLDFDGIHVFDAGVLEKFYESEYMGVCLTVWCSRGGQCSYVSTWLSSSKNHLDGIMMKLPVSETVVFRNDDNMEYILVFDPGGSLKDHYCTTISFRIQGDFSSIVWIFDSSITGARVKSCEESEFGQQHMNLMRKVISATACESERGYFIFYLTGFTSSDIGLFIFDPGGNYGFSIVMSAIFAGDLYSLGLHGGKMNLTFLHPGREIQWNDTILVFDLGGPTLDQMGEITNLSPKECPCLHLRSPSSQVVHMHKL